MHDEPQLQNNGIIFVDTCSLTRLARPVDREHRAPVRRFTSDAPRYIDPLALIAKHLDMEVRIPAMVVWEACGTSPGGYDPRFQAKRMHADYSPLQDWYSKFAAPQRNYVGEVIRGNYPNMRMMMPDAYDQSPPAKFVRFLDEIEKKYMWRDVSLPPRRDKFFRDLKYMEGIDTDQFGDQAIERAVRALPRDYGKPVICLSDDCELAPKLRKARPDLSIIALSSKGYLTAICDSGLQELAQIQIPSPAVAHASLEGVSEEIRKFFPRDRATLLKEFDTSLDYDCQCGDLPFLHMMKQQRMIVADSVAHEREQAARSAPEGYITPAQEERLETREAERRARLWARFQGGKRGAGGLNTGSDDDGARGGRS